MSTTFIALQCCKCSTMQVKQQKKSSNKWTCVVCNQKQSVRKVFAQGYMAKDLRKFVQSFNMARKVADEKLAENDAVLVNEKVEEFDWSDSKRPRKRSDWSEYLDVEDAKELNEEGGDDGDFQVKFVTEMPNEMFKKPKLKNYSSPEVCGKLMKPVFIKRSANKQPIAREKEPDEKFRAMAVRTSKGTEYSRHDGSCKEMEPGQPVIERGTCKWDSYIDDDNDDDGGFQHGKGTESASSMGQWSGDMFDTVVDDQVVEEDVHPDFM